MTEEIKSFSDKKYPVVLIDPPWSYYGDPNKDQAAGKHYKIMSDMDISRLPVSDTLLYPNSVLFVWATSPKLDVAIACIKSWGLYYRGIAFDWCKTTLEGHAINGQGVRPSLIKHAGELVLWASFLKKGRPLPLKSESIPSWVFAPRPKNIHSAKPEIIQDRIEQLLDGPYLEIFSRRERSGWDGFGDQYLSGRG